MLKFGYSRIPGGLTEAEYQELNTILIENNFPLIK